MNSILEMLSSGLVLLCNIILMSSLIEFKYSKKITVFYIFSIWIFVCCVMVISFCTIGLEKAKSFSLVLTALPIVLLMFMISADSFFKYTFLLFTEINIFFIIIGINYCIFRDSSHLVLQRMIFNGIFFVVVIFIYNKFLKKPFRAVADAIDSGWWRISLLAIAFTFVFSITILMPFPNVLQTIQSQMVFYSLIILIIMAYLVMFNSLRFMLLSYGKKVEMEQILSRQNILFEQLKAQDEAIELTKQYHHDIRHHTNIILKYLHDENFSGAQKYLEEYCNLIDNGVVKQYCKNQMINAVLCLFEKELEKENVSKDINVIISDEISLDRSDIVSIFANILENAVDACKKIDGERVVILNSEINDDVLKINLENSFDGYVQFIDGIPLTTKKSGGGIGTKSVRHIVEKYHGMVNYTAENNRFITQIIIHI